MSPVSGRKTIALGASLWNRWFDFPAPEGGVRKLYPFIKLLLAGQKMVFRLTTLCVAVTFRPLRGLWHHVLLFPPDLRLGLPYIARFAG
jgi:hypothetical protein